MELGQNTLRIISPGNKVCFFFQIATNVVLFFLFFSKHFFLFVFHYILFCLCVSIMKSDIFDYFDFFIILQLEEITLKPIIRSWRVQYCCFVFFCFFLNIFFFLFFITYCFAYVYQLWRVIFLIILTFLSSFSLKE